MEKPRLLYLSQNDVATVGIPMADIVSRLEIAFREKGRGRVEMPPKPGIHPGPPDSFIHAMPAYIPALKSAGVKWVSGFPENPAQGLPYINGLLILNDPETGLALSVMDCVWITAMRTGAATALSAKYLARPDAAVVGILGCGVQGRTNVEALNVVFKLKRVMAYDVNPQARQSYVQEITGRFGIETVGVDDPRKAVSGCDIVVTAGPILKTPHATIKAGWLDHGAFASLVDFDSYWEPAAMQEAGLFCTDDTAQLRYYQSVGYFKAIPPVHADLGELVAGTKPGRQDPKQRTMAANLGLALDDMAVAPLVYQKACQLGLGTWLAL
jgi:ornithine cyclodeaminase/alanine dehydrogenase